MAMARLLPPCCSPAAAILESVRLYHGDPCLNDVIEAMYWAVCWTVTGGNLEVAVSTESSSMCGYWSSMVQYYWIAIPAATLAVHAIPGLILKLGWRF